MQDDIQDSKKDDKTEKRTTKTTSSKKISLSISTKNKPQTSNEIMIESLNLEIKQLMEDLEKTNALRSQAEQGRSDLHLQLVTNTMEYAKERAYLLQEIQRITFGHTNPTAAEEIARLNTCLENQGKEVGRLYKEIDKVTTQKDTKITQLKENLKTKNSEIEQLHKRFQERNNKIEQLKKNLEENLVKDKVLKKTEKLLDKKMAEIKKLIQSQEDLKKKISEIEQLQKPKKDLEKKTPEIEEGQQAQKDTAKQTAETKLLQKSLHAKTIEAEEYFKNMQDMALDVIEWEHNARYWRELSQNLAAQMGVQLSPPEFVANVMLPVQSQYLAAASQTTAPPQARAKRPNSGDDLMQPQPITRQYKHAVSSSRVRQPSSPQRRSPKNHRSR